MSVSLRRFLFVIFTIAVCVNLSACSSGSWKDARRDSANIAPPARDLNDAIVQVYAADAWGWRGIFAVHTWIAVKPSNADNYTVLEVIGWREKSGLPVLRIEKDTPDRFWFGAKPELLIEHRGEGVDAMIDEILVAANQYPWANTYQVFPGPNSNTFPAWINQQVPSLGLELPFRAIGSGWID